MKLATIIFVILILRKIFRGSIIYEQLKTKASNENQKNKSPNDDAIEAEYSVIE